MKGLSDYSGGNFGHDCGGEVSGDFTGDRVGVLFSSIPYGTELMASSNNNPIIINM